MIDLNTIKEALEEAKRIQIKSDERNDMEINVPSGLLSHYLSLAIFELERIEEVLAERKKRLEEEKVEEKHEEEVKEADISELQPLS